MQILSKTQAELPHIDSAVVKGVNSWPPKPFGASTKSRHSDHMLSKIQILEIYFGQEWLPTPFLHLSARFY